MSTDIRISIADGICEICFDRAAKKNAITRQMYAAMRDALDEADRNDAVRVVMFTSTGDLFTAGNDINDFLAASPDVIETPVQGFLRVIVGLRKPVIAVVKGKAVGIGTTLLLHCDMVIAAPGAVFIAPFVDLALVPEAGSSLMIPALMGHQRAFAFLALGEPLTADAALAVGLVNRLVPVDIIEAEGRQIAAALAAKPPQALRATKELMRGDRTPLLDRIRLETSHFKAQLTTSESHEALTAFLEKRPANFAQPS